jgi:hypothetical protein
MKRLKIPKYQFKRLLLSGYSMRFLSLFRGRYREKRINRYTHGCYDFFLREMKDLYRVCNNYEYYEFMSNIIYIHDRYKKNIIKKEIRLKKEKV